MAFNENTRVKIPAILHLCRLGYCYISLGSAKRDESTNIFSDILEGFKKTTSSSSKQTYKSKQMQPERGGDVHTDVNITFLESLEGTTRTINILHTEACKNCDGRPFVNGNKCPICNGLGEQSIHKKLNVKIPANIKHGSKIRIANEGNIGYNRGKNGDLYLNIKIESFPANMIAGTFGFKEMELFETTNDAERQPVSVKF